VSTEIDNVIKSQWEIGPQTDIAIAERVLRRDEPFQIDNRGVARGAYNAEVPCFSSSDAIAVMYVLPKLREKCRTVIQILPATAPVDVFPDEERIIVEIGFGQRVVMGKAGSIALAICRAALAMADQIRGKS
jgi:hypothetical protein